MAENGRYPRVVTPKGTAIFPRLNSPDTKFKAEGVYEVKLAFDPDTPGLDELRRRARAIVDAEYQRVVEKLTSDGKPGLAKKITKSDPFKAEEDPQTGEATGRVFIKARMNASGISKKTGKPWTRRPDIFDARGNRLARPPLIGGGTELKLAVELAPYYAAADKVVGCSFRLEAAQIIRLVSFGERDAGGYGFGAEEGDDLSDYRSAEQEFGADTVGVDDEDDEL